MSKSYIPKNYDKLNNLCFSKLSKIEELLSSAKFKNYMSLLRRKYNLNYYDVKPKIKIVQKKLEKASSLHKKP